LHPTFLTKMYWIDGIICQILNYSPRQGMHANIGLTVCKMTACKWDSICRFRLNKHPLYLQLARVLRRLFGRWLTGRCRSVCLWRVHFGRSGKARDVPTEMWKMLTAEPQNTFIYGGLSCCVHLAAPYTVLPFGNPSPFAKQESCFWTCFYLTKASVRWSGEKQSIGMPCGICYDIMPGIHGTGLHSEFVSRSAILIGGGGEIRIAGWDN